MTKKEFLEKYPIQFGSFLEELVFFELLDKVYVGFTRQQALELMDDFYMNADDIFNSIRQEEDEAIEMMKELFKDILDNGGSHNDA